MSLLVFSTKEQEQRGSRGLWKEASTWAKHWKYKNSLTDSCSTQFLLSSHLFTLFVFLSLLFELWARFPACFCQSPLSEQQLHGSVHRIILHWKTTSLIYLKSAGTLLPRQCCPIACLPAIPSPKAGGLVGHWWACYLAAGTVRASRPRSLPLSWIESHFRLGLIFGIFIFWPASMSVFYLFFWLRKWWRMCD